MAHLSAFQRKLRVGCTHPLTQFLTHTQFLTRARECQPSPCLRAFANVLGSKLSTLCFSSCVLACAVFRACCCIAHPVERWEGAFCRQLPATQTRAGTHPAHAVKERLVHFLFLRAPGKLYSYAQESSQTCV